jgi:hypothetical protein
MADKSPTIDINDPYRPADYDFGVLYGSAAPKPSWTDGLPHNFQGWGPQTPDPDAPASEAGAFRPDDSLTFSGDSHDHNHHVWHFDGRRHRH